ncbi:TolC family protein [Exilibacterium tricleocarpae]|uniref:TolC family protein n=1 Tax=Exilibacterium tricleocarpae TaxID=2591008 RepID=A0A545T8J1_9GAMM|nr:TolC family protein [Exilibacterium tricleocarpae]TQV73505.1 TolC family protein [Exilibacterium tricleocarpae]
MKKSIFTQYNKIKRTLYRWLIVYCVLLGGSITVVYGTELRVDDLLDQQTFHTELLSRREFVGPFVQQALRYNPSLQAADAQFQAARASIKSAGVLPNPKLQLSHFIESIQTRTGPQEQAIMLQQAIPWPTKLSRKRDIAEAQAQALWHAAISEQFKVVDKVAKGVLDIAYLEKALEISQRHLSLLEQLVAVVKTRVESGGGLSQLLHLQVEVAQVEDRLAWQTAEVASQTSMLEALLGKEEGRKRLNLSWQVPPPLREDKSLWLRASVEQSPQIKMLEALEDSSDARLRLAKLVNLPDFSVGINRISTGEAINSDMPDSGKDPWAVVVGVSLPLWQGANQAKIREANFSRQAVSAKLKALELSIKAKTRSRIIALSDAEQRLSRYQSEILPLAKQAREIAESSYLTGKADILSVIDSDRALLNLQQKYWRAAADAWIARWQLTTLSGGLWLN